MKCVLVLLELAALTSMLGCGFSQDAFRKAAGRLKVDEDAYRAAGLPWVSDQVQVDIGSPNAASLVKEAIASLPTDEIPVPKALTATSATFDLNRFNSAVKLAQEAADRPNLNFRRDWDLGPYVRIEEPLEMKRLVRILVAEAVTYASRGASQTAAGMLASATRLAHLIGQEPTVISTLCCLGAQQIVLDGFVVCARLLKHKPGSLLFLAARVLSPPSIPPAASTLRGDAYLRIAVARNLDAYGGMAGVEKLVASVQHRRTTPPTAPGIDRLLRVGVPNKEAPQAYLDGCLRYSIDVNRLARRAALPEQAYDLIGTYEAKIRAQGESSFSLAVLLSPDYSIVAKGIRDLRTRFKAIQALELGEPGAAIRKSLQQTQ